MIKEQGMDIQNQQGQLCNDHRADLESNFRQIALHLPDDATNQLHVIIYLYYKFVQE